jgi:hypothetical protein
MEKIKFDSGVQEFRINGSGVLRFNPGDPNVFARFMESAKKMEELEQRLSTEAKALEDADNAGMMALMQRTDKQIKELLGWVFGPANDFDVILGGVSLLAVADNGQRVIANLFDALRPVLEDGARRCARQTAAGIKSRKTAK